MNAQALALEVEVEVEVEVVNSNEAAKVPVLEAVPSHKGPAVFSRGFVGGSTAALLNDISAYGGALEIVDASEVKNLQSELVAAMDDLPKFAELSAKLAQVNRRIANSKDKVIELEDALRGSLEQMQLVINRIKDALPSAETGKKGA